MVLGATFALVGILVWGATAAAHRKPDALAFRGDHARRRCGRHRHHPGRHDALRQSRDPSLRIRPDVNG
jgi:hypothetical protein